MRETKISIVVPVYNAEKELQRCVDSIFRQSFSNWELLLIDDGSRDSSSALCDRLGAQDTRVRVWHKENGGVSSARNLGICKAEGEYLFFTDSDDTLFPDTLATLYQKAKSIRRGSFGVRFYISGGTDERMWITFRKKLSAVEEKNIWRSGFYRTSGGDLASGHGIS